MKFQAALEKESIQLVRHSLHDEDDQITVLNKSQQLEYMPGLSSRTTPCLGH